MAIDALKGRDLNLLVDKYMNDGIQEGNLRRQGEELAYIEEMHHRREVRLDFDEVARLYSMRDELARRVMNVVED